MRNFEIFEVSPNAEKLRQFREEYIRTFEGDLINRIISRSRKWYNYSKGVYTPSTIGLSVKQIARANELLAGFDAKDKKNKIFKYYANSVSDFISYGVSSSNQVKALSIKHDDDIEFFKPVNQYYYLLEAPQKKGTSYITDSISINEDLYNMAMIQYRNFEATTTPEDLSRYAEYFNIGDKPYLFVSEEAIEDWQRCGYVSEDKIEEITKTLSINEKAILSLRK